ncbi:Zinc finger protein 267 [Plecturocebus cupreus]
MAIKFSLEWQYRNPAQQAWYSNIMIENYKKCSLGLSVSNLYLVTSLEEKKGTWNTKNEETAIQPVLGCICRTHSDAASHFTGDREVPATHELLSADARSRTSLSSTCHPRSQAFPQTALNLNPAPSGSHCSGSRTTFHQKTSASTNLKEFSHLSVSTRHRVIANSDSSKESNTVFLSRSNEQWTMCKVEGCLLKAFKARGCNCSAVFRLKGHEVKKAFILEH